MSLEERLEQAEKLVAEVKAELAAMRAEKATKRNWPERIEAGMVFKAKMTEATWMAVDGANLVCIANGEKGGYGVMCDIASPNALDYLGHARDILTIRTDAHEPTGAELVGILEDIRNVSNNPGRTLTTLGLTECLQSCNVMARNALEGLAK